MKHLFLIVFCVFLVRFVPPVFADSSVVINEALVHPSTGNKEWVELYTSGLDVKDYWIDDDTDFASDTGSSGKKQITEVVQGADSHHVVFELSSAIFNNDADTIALFSPDGQLIDQYHYSSDPGVDVAIGRTPDGTGGFSVLATATRGSANSASKPADTPTPEPTAKPTKEPKATSVPASSKSTSSTAPTAQSIPISESSTETTDENSYDTSDEEEGSLSARPTSVLGIATKAAEKKKKVTPTPQVLVKGASKATLPLVLTSFGGLFLLACGILIYLKKKGIWQRDD